MRDSWNFDIDRYLNRLVPSPPWQHVPYPIAHFLGYRKAPLRDIGNLMPIFWAFIGVFCSISIIEQVGLHVPSFQSRSVPLIVGSFGAAAVLEFYAIEAPLAQPRNAVFGQLISAFTGVAVCKLFLLSDNFSDLQWLGGAIACAAATSLMALTKTVHPPAGATALLAVVDNDLVHLGWFLIPVMLLGCGLMLGVALLINNLERRFPVYWWTPEDLRARHGKPMLQRQHKDETEDVEKQQKDTTGDEGEQESKDAAAVGKSAQTVPPSELVIRHGMVSVPEHMYLTDVEMQFLETLSERI